MRILSFAMLILACLSTWFSGCQQAANENSKQTTGSSQTREDNELTATKKAIGGKQATTKSWILYSPPEKDFSVMAPEDSVEAKSSDTKVGKFRTYIFKKGSTPHFELKIHSERKGALAENTVEELKSDTSDYIPGSLQDISLVDMPGIEFRMKGAIGETVFREFCSSDNSLSISLLVQKDTGAGLTEKEVRQFLDSFKRLP